MAPEDSAAIGRTMDRFRVARDEPRRTAAERRPGGLAQPGIRVLRDYGLPVVEMDGTGPREIGRLEKERLRRALTQGP